MMDTKQKIDGVEIATSQDETKEWMCKAWFVGANNAQYKEFGFGETEGEAIDTAIQACKDHPMWTPQVVETPAAAAKYEIGQRVKIVCSDIKPYQGAIGTIDIVYPDDRQGYDYRVAVNGMHKMHFDHDELTPLTDELSAAELEALRELGQPNVSNVRPGVIVYEVYDQLIQYGYAVNLEDSKMRYNSRYRITPAGREALRLHDAPTATVAPIEPNLEVHLTKAEILAVVTGLFTAVDYLRDRASRLTLDSEFISPLIVTADEYEAIASNLRNFIA
jgi:hypothetical protein